MDLNLPDESAQFCAQQAEIDRLRDEVIRQLETIEHGLSVVQHGKEQDRRVDLAGLGTDAARGLQPVHHRHHDVHQHEIAPGGAAPPPGTIVGHDYRMPFRAGRLPEYAGLLVVGNKHLDPEPTDASMISEHRP
jgi:hypothetical protein